VKLFGFDTAWVGLAVKGRKAMAEIEKAQADGWDWKKTLWKGAKTFALALSMQVVPSLLAALSNDQFVASTLKSAGAPVAVVTTVTALIVACVKMAANYWNHRDDAR